MADRTLVVYEREHGFDTHYAHDGVDPGRLGPATPSGGDADRDLRQLRDLLADRGIVLGPDRDGPAVDPEPLETGQSWPAVVASLDYRAYDRCLRVDRDWTTTTFLVCWFGFEARGGESRDPVGDGALLGVDTTDEPFAHGWFEGLKSAVSDGLCCGLYDETRRVRTSAAASGRSPGSARRTSRDRDPSAAPFCRPVTNPDR